MKKVFSLGFLFILLTIATLQGDESQSTPSSTQFMIMNHTDWTVCLTLSEGLENNTPHLYPSQPPQFSPLAIVEIEPHQTYTLSVDLLHSGLQQHPLQIDWIQNSYQRHLFTLHTEILRQNKHEFFEVLDLSEVWFSYKQAERTVLVDHQPIYQIELFEKLTNRGQSYIAEPTLKGQ